MLTPTDLLAKAAAQYVLKLARSHGYEIVPSRAVFVVSDQKDFEADIHRWIEAHMRQQKEF